MQRIVKTRKLKDRIKGINSMKLIKKKLVTKQKTVTYTRFVAYILSQKNEPRRMKLTTGGNILEDDGEKSTESSGLETTKTIVNSVISTPEARFGCFDISNM